METSAAPEVRTTHTPARIFLLSPAHCGGQRARMLMRDAARFELALRLQANGASVGEIFAFLSGLYFRGKLAYAQFFGKPPKGWPASLVITTNRGLIAPDTNLTLAELRAMGQGSIDAEDERYAGPLRRDIQQLARVPDCEAILLGSIATGKYVDHLLPLLGERLRFPAEFVGRGDMSRGGLMLRSVKSGSELEYVAVAGAMRRGARPPKLDQRRPTASGAARK